MDIQNHQKNSIPLHCVIPKEMFLHLFSLLDTKKCKTTTHFLHSSFWEVSQPQPNQQHIEKYHINWSIDVQEHTYLTFILVIGLG